MSWSGDTTGSKRKSRSAVPWDFSSLFLLHSWEGCAKEQVHPVQPMCLYMSVCAWVSLNSKAWFRSMHVGNAYKITRFPDMHRNTLLFSRRTGWHSFLMAFPCICKCTFFSVRQTAWCCSAICFCVASFRELLYPHFSWVGQPIEMNRMPCRQHVETREKREEILDHTVPVWTSFTLVLVFEEQCMFRSLFRKHLTHCEKALYRFLNGCFNPLNSVLAWPTCVQCRASPFRWQGVSFLPQPKSITAGACVHHWPLPPQWEWLGGDKKAAMPRACTTPQLLMWASP